MAKETVDKTIAEIKKLLKDKKLIIGTERTIKNLKLGRISKVYVSSNCPENVNDDISYYSKLANAAVLKLSYPNDELGVICKKPFSISVLSILR